MLEARWNRSGFRIVPLRAAYHGLIAARQLAVRHARIGKKLRRTHSHATVAHRRDGALWRCVRAAVVADLVEIDLAKDIRGRLGDVHVARRSVASAIQEVFTVAPLRVAR